MLLLLRMVPPSGVETVTAERLAAVALLRRVVVLSSPAEEPIVAALLVEEDEVPEVVAALRVVLPLWVAVFLVGVPLWVAALRVEDELVAALLVAEDVLRVVLPLWVAALLVGVPLWEEALRVVVPLWEERVLLLCMEALRVAEALLETEGLEDETAALLVEDELLLTVAPLRAEAALVEFAVAALRRTCAERSAVAPVRMAAIATVAIMLKYLFITESFKCYLYK